MNFIDRKLDYSLWGIILISSIMFFFVDVGNSFKYAEPTTYSCVNRSLLSLISFGYNEPCCCSSDHQPFYYLIGKVWKVLFGFSHTSFKVLAFVFYQISILVLYRFGKIFLKNKLLIFSFPLCFILNFQFQALSNYVYMYIHYFLFLTIAYSQLMFKKEIEERDLIIYLGSLLIGSMFFYMTYIHLGISILVCMIMLKKKFFTKKLIFLGFISLVLFIFKTPVVFMHRMSNFAKGSYDYGLKGTIKDIAELFFGSQSLDPKLFIIYGIVSIIAIIGFVQYIKIKKLKLPAGLIISTSLVSIIMYFYLRLKDYNEIKSEYFISLLLFFNVFVFLFLEKTNNYIRYFLLISFLFVLGVGLKMNLSWQSHKAYDPLLSEVKSFVEDKPNTRIYFSNNDTKLWLFGMYESAFGVQLQFIRLGHKVLNCPQDSNFYYFEADSSEFRLNSSFETKCLSLYEKINEKKFRIDSYPNFWTLIEFKKK